VDLSKYAWMFRYPGDPIEPSTEEAREVLARARVAVDEVRGRIFGLTCSAVIFTDKQAVFCCF
jgi:hypothetical protein